MTTRKRSATMNDVARRARVSLKTVSRVVNREASVLDATRTRVELAIEELGYRPDQSARSLRSAKSYTIGMVYDNPNAYYIIALQNGVLSVCRQSGFELNIHPCDSRSPDLADELCELVRRSRLAGLVLAPPMSEHMPLIETLAANGIKFVRILSAARDPRDGFPCVFVDDRDAAYAITCHLIELGHRRIGFLWGGRAHRSSAERFKGYQQALKHYRIATDKALVLHGDYSFEDGFRGAQTLLASENPPTAIFGSNDEIAAGVLAAAKGANLNVPGDLSIAGFEDSPFSRQSWPALTTAKQATADIAMRATERLIADIAHRIGDARYSNENMGFSPSLVIRGSTGPARPPRRRAR